jgi:uncharacterized protein (TIGR02246 family)
MTAHTPQQVDEQFAAAVNAGDLAALVELYEPHAPLVADTGETLATPEARRAYVEGFFGMNPKIDMRTAKVIRNGDLALMFSPWTCQCTGPHGSPVDMSGNSVVVLRRQPDNTWRFAIDDPGWA